MIRFSSELYAYSVNEFEQMHSQEFQEYIFLFLLPPQVQKTSQRGKKNNQLYEPLNIFYWCFIFYIEICVHYEQICQKKKKNWKYGKKK